MQQTRDSVLRYGVRGGRVLLNAVVRCRDETYESMRVPNSDRKKGSFNLMMGHYLGTYSIKWADPNGRTSKECSLPCRWL